MGKERGEGGGLHRPCHCTLFVKSQLFVCRPIFESLDATKIPMENRKSVANVINRSAAYQTIHLDEFHFSAKHWNQSRVFALVALLQPVDFV